MKNNQLKNLFLFTALLFSVTAYSTVVRFETDFGNIDIEMYENESPLNVENFLSYVNAGEYDNSIIHRSVQNFIVQGGALKSNGNALVEIPTNSPVVNEFSQSNVRGTVAMAKLAGDPDSATNNFFFNLEDNSANLDSQNEGFTVVGQVIAGMEVVDLLGSIKAFFNTGTPLIAYNTTEATQLENYVYINKAFVLSEEFQINTALSGAWFNPDTNGQGIYFEVLPSVDTLIMAWFAYDTEQPDASVPSTVGAAGNRWLTASGNYQGNQFVGDVFKTSGGLFDDPTSVSTTGVGEVTITFTNCVEAVMSYVLNDSGLSNTVNIQRISGANVELCEQFSDQADPGISTQ